MDVPVVPEGFHKGSLERKGGFINVSVPNVVVTAFKFCEDGSGDVILRCYETQGKEDTKAEIRCDLINMNFSVNIYKHEIKTFRVSPDGKAKDINFLEGIVQ